MARSGLDTSDYSFSYIARWARVDGVVRRNLGESQRVNSHLIRPIEGVADPYADGFGTPEMWTEEDIDRLEEYAEVPELPEGSRKP